MNLKNLFVREKKQDLTYILFIVLFFIIINIFSLIDYFSNPLVPGWDGTGHASISYLYNQNIFPNMFGFLDVWFNGMPFPQFYPPMFYFFSSIFAFWSNYQTFFILFKLFVISIIVLLIPAFYFLNKIFTKDTKKIVFSTCLFSILLSVYGIFVHSGVVLQSNLNSGLVTQTFAFLFFLIFLNFWYREFNFRNRLFAILALSMVALSNVHTLLVSILFLFIDLIVFYFSKRDFKQVTLRISDLILSALITSFWVIPMIYYYDYASAKSWYWMTGMSVSFILTILIIFINAILFLFLNSKDYKLISFSILTIFIVIFSFGDPTKIFSSIPFHPIRWLIVPSLLFPILFSNIFFDYKENKKINLFTKVSLVLLIIIFISSYQLRNNEGYYTKYEKDNLEEIIKYLKEDPNLALNIVNVETVYLRDKESDLYTINSLLGLNGIKTTYNIFRESSASAFSMVAIRNSLSSENESWGIKAELGSGNIYKEKNIDFLIKNAVNYGVNKYLIRSNQMINLFEESELAYLEKDFGNWKLYSAIEDNVLLVSDPLATVAVYTNLDLKNYNQNLFEWTRIVEGLMYLGDTDVVLYKTNNNDLSESRDYLDSSVILIAEYKYSNSKLALQNIEKMLESKKVFFVKDLNSDLFLEIRNSFRNNKNYHELEMQHWLPTSEDYFNALSKQLKRVTETAKLYKNSNWEYLKRSYFPQTLETNKEYYLASPFYYLISKNNTNTEKSFNVIFLSSLISVISILLGLIYLRKTS